MTDQKEHADTAEASFDAREVAQFDQIADTWWDPKGPFKPLHDLAPARLAFIRDAIDDAFLSDPRVIRPLKGRTALDVGCGGGLIAEPLARLGATVTGIDLGEETLRVAAAHAETSDLDIDYRCKSVEALAAANETFDLVTCLEVIEHVPDQSAFVRALARVVAPGGLLVMSTISRTAKSYAFAIVGAEYVLRWLAPGTHDWSRFVTPAKLEAMIGETGLELDRTDGVTLDPLQGVWQISRDTDVNYMLSARRPSS